VKTVKLFLVEDNPVLARAIPSQMTKYGYEVLGVSSDGEDALAKFSGLAIDLVLMDIDLGGPMDGVATAHAMQKIREVPVVFITSHTGPEIQARVRDVKSALCLSKPFTEREISLTIELCLLRMRFEREQARWLATKPGDLPPA
jgi:DNA-binding response OmpR family regulator